jgi:Tfp pilus assembly protein PilF
LNVSGNKPALDLPSKYQRFLYLVVCLYAGIAGLHTVVDFDLGWQMAQARTPWSSVDTLSYTASGAAWIYPPFAGMMFRGLFAVGGYAAISWLCAVALVFIVAIVAYRRPAVVSMLLIASMPALARQMIPRSGMFTVVFAALTVRVLFDYKASCSKARLWLLPLGMIAWVNLHPGFIAGLALLLGYLVSEAVDLLNAGERPAVVARIRRAAPWIAATFLATFINPWGWRMYQVVAAQESPTALQASVIREIAPLYDDFTLHSLNPINPLNAIWVLLLVCMVALVLLLMQRRVGLAVFLGLAMTACLLSARSQGVFIPIGCLVAGDAFSGSPVVRRVKGSLRWPVMAWGLCGFTLAIVAVRSFGIITNRAAVREDQIVTFGVGPSWWIPQKAADFIEKHHLPGELFASFNLSSYVAGRLPQYKDFADGRYLPFRNGIVAEQLSLTALPLDSSAWSTAATQWKINTVIFPLARFYGIETVPLRENCASRSWTPVYLDTSAIVLVRNNAIPRNQLDALRIDCQTVPLTQMSAATRIDEYQQTANAAVILFVLGRNQEAQAMLTHAQSLFKDDDSLSLLQGELQEARNDTADAQKSFDKTVALHPSDSAWYQLGLFEAKQQDFPDAVRDFQKALALEKQPSSVIEIALARGQIAAGASDRALSLLDRVETEIPSGQENNGARAEIDDLRAAAYAQLSNWPQAVVSAQKAVEQTPEVADRWERLASIYTAVGDTQHATEARDHAEKLVMSN